MPPTLIWTLFLFSGLLTSMMEAFSQSGACAFSILTLVASNWSVDVRIRRLSSRRKDRWCKSCQCTERLINVNRRWPICSYMYQYPFFLHALWTQSAFQLFQLPLQLQVYHLQQIFSAANEIMLVLQLVTTSLLGLWQHYTTNLYVNKFFKLAYWSHSCWYQMPLLSVCSIK